MSTFSKTRSADYRKKQNMMQNNWPSDERAKRTRLNEGDGIIPKSRKFRDWSCKPDCKKLHRADKKTGKVVHEFKA